MRRIRFRDPAGSIRNGSLTDGKITFADRTYEPSEVTVLPPVEPTKIICVGLNYIEHADETDSDVPDRPLLFMKGQNAVSSHGNTITLPEEKERIDFEGELGVVIGEQCRNVPAERAEEVVEGYTCVNDLSNRDDQRQEQNWIRGKAFDNAAPIGPVLATPDEVPSDASIRTLRNGEVQQESTIDTLYFSVPDLIEEVTDLITLEPGDVIATGTPDGVGPISDGDTIEVEIEGIGTLRNEFVAATEFDGPVEQDFMPDL